MMIKSVLTPLGILLAVALVVTCQEETKQESTTPAGEQPLQVVEFNSNQHKIKVPLYENVVPATRRRLEFDRQVVRQIMEVVDSLVKDLAIRHKNVVLASGSAIPKIIGIILKKKGEFKAMEGNDTLPVIKDGYSKEMAGFMKSILGSKYKGPKILSDVEVYERTKLLMEAVTKVPEHSPSGLYVNWRQLEIDGQRLDKFSDPIIEWFRNSGGRKFCLARAKQVVGLLENLGL